MTLNDEDIRKFQELWRADFGEEISVDQARHEASLLIELYAMLAEALPGELNDGFGSDGATQQTP